MTTDCPFCRKLETATLDGDGLVAAFPDAFPVSPGHTLIVPRRHVETYLDASEDERTALWVHADRVITCLRESHCPDGFNVGINVGRAAGQTVMHLHLHVIPRYAGDVDDPRGGIRHVVPGKARYWT